MTEEKEALDTETDLNQAKQRKPRSDRGTKKPPKANSDDLNLHLTIGEARLAALTLGDHDYAYQLATKIQEQIIGHLQAQLARAAKGINR